MSKHFRMWISRRIVRCQECTEDSIFPLFFDENAGDQASRRSDYL